MPGNPVREFTQRQAEIVHGIWRALDYEEIGQEMGIKESTVRQCVKQMANLFDTDSQRAFPPRQRLFVWATHLEWKIGRAITVQDIRDASRESHQRYTAALHAYVTR